MNKPEIIYEQTRWHVSEHESTPWRCILNIKISVPSIALATVEVLYAANAQIGEGPFYEQETNQLLWVDSKEQTVNFLSIDTRVNRFNGSLESVSLLWAERCHISFALQVTEDARPGRSSYTCGEIQQTCGPSWEEDMSGWQRDR